MIAYTNYRSDPRVIREAEAALRGGFAVDFLALRRDGDPGVEDIRGVMLHHVNQTRYRGKRHICYLWAYLEFFLRCLFKSAALWWSRRYRVIHVNNMPDFMVFATLIPKLMGAKVILDIHDPMPDTFASKFRSVSGGLFFRLLLWQERLSAWYSDAVITVHDPVKDHVLVKHGLRADEIHVVANFPDGDIFRLKDYPEFGEKLKLVFHGTILERYGLRGLLQALAKVRRPDRLSVMVIGEGDFSQEFAGLIQSLGVGSLVHFDNRTYPVHEIPALLDGAHLGLVPLEISAITNFALPLKLVEYIAMGLPAVTVRSVAICHYFKDDDCLFFDPSAPETLTRLLDAIVEDPEMLMPFRQRSVELREKFLWSGEQEKYVQLLWKLAGLPRPQPDTMAPVTDEPVLRR